MQQHVIQHAAQHITGVGIALGYFYRFGDGTAQTAGRIGHHFQDLAAHHGSIGRRRRDFCAVGLHHGLAMWFQLGRALDHIHTHAQTKIAAGHGQCSTPLACAGFGGDFAQALLLGVISLGHGGVQFMTAAGVGAFVLIIDLCRGVQQAFQIVGTHHGRGAHHTVKVPHLLGNGDKLIGGVQFLLHRLVTENGFQRFLGDGLLGFGIQHGRQVGDDGAQIHPRTGHFVFFQKNLVRDGFFAHILSLLFYGREIKNTPVLCCFIGQERCSCGATYFRLATHSSACQHTPTAITPGSRPT